MKVGSCWKTTLLVNLHLQRAGSLDSSMTVVDDVVKHSQDRKQHNSLCILAWISGMGAAGGCVSPLNNHCIQTFTGVAKVWHDELCAVTCLSYVLFLWQYMPFQARFQCLKMLLLPIIEEGSISLGSWRDHFKEQISWSQTWDNIMWCNGTLRLVTGHSVPCWTRGTPQTGAEGGLRGFTHPLLGEAGLMSPLETFWGFGADVLGRGCI